MIVIKCDLCEATITHLEMMNKVPHQSLLFEEDNKLFDISIDHMCKKCWWKMYYYMKSLVTKEVKDQHKIK